MTVTILDFIISDRIFYVHDIYVIKVGNILSAIPSTMPLWTHMLQTHCSFEVLMCDSS